MENFWGVGSWLVISLVLGLGYLLLCGVYRLSILCCLQDALKSGCISRRFLGI